jgi:hypothetical protein|tara:strand:+ start:407 stop:1129 length:723 start_codon:yes stop_codon:yes gene_type:complete
MALANYADLLASINSKSGWLHRNDLAEIVPDWVTLCEVTINKGDLDGLNVESLRVGDMETTWDSSSTKPATTTSGVQTVALPDDFLEFRSPVFITFQGFRRELTQRPPSPMSLARRGEVESIPQTYWITGNNINLDPVPDGGYNITADYYAKVPSLEANSTNWLMTEAPGVYLYGALAQGLLWLGPEFVNSPRGIGFMQAFKTSLAQVRRADIKKRFKNVRMRTDAARMTGPQYSIISGY